MVRTPTSSASADERRRRAELMSHTSSVEENRLVVMGKYNPHIFEDTTMSISESTHEYESEYRSSITPRTATRVSRGMSGLSSASSQASGGRVLKIVTEMGSSTVSGMSPALSANAAQSFLQATEKEKKEMQNLNDRLSNYIDRVKGLEAQNRKLVADLEDLRGRWGKDTSEIKLKYSDELNDARKYIDDMARQKAEIEVQIARLQEDIAEFRRSLTDAFLTRTIGKLFIVFLSNCSSADFCVLMLWAIIWTRRDVQFSYSVIK
ncbi:unnamed protein product [Soboliphyme baturini]|uniref:IF rod domain-containing protein n=1 Tax=Soboliphyme baturini TaxID=241478 RepID=A0A183INV5_9BILA|nr:unnamed protein product [Soboliphyme baturini]